jgi:hypothetical protein
MDLNPYQSPRGEDVQEDRADQNESTIRLIVGFLA